MRIGIIGTGTIASAVVEALASGDHPITVSERNAANASRLAAAYDTVSIATNAGVVEQSDVIILGLMAEVAGDVLQTLPLRPDQKVISLMAGLTLNNLDTMVAPAKLNAIMIPFPNIAVGGSAILVRGEVGLVEDLFGHDNTVFTIATDEALHANLCAQAVLSPSVKLVADAAAWLTSQTDDAQQAEMFLRVLVGSSLQCSECASLLAALNTPGGYNQRLLQHMDKAGLTGSLTSGLRALRSGD